MRKILFSISIILFSNIYCQDLSSLEFSKDYKPQFVLDTAPEAHTKIYKEAYQSIKNAKKLELYDGKIGKSIKESHLDRVEYLSSLLHRKEVLYEGPIYDYLNHLIDKIKVANNIKNETRLYVLRENTVNASSWGEGTILFHLGLLSILENESQVIGVLSHEMAHYILNHSELTIKQNAEIFKSDSLKKQIKSVLRSDYDRYRRLTNLMKRYEFNYAYHSRGHETEADSIGYILMSKTNYDLKEFARVMDILDSSKTIKNYTNLDIPKYFKFDSLPMKQDWFVYKLDNNFKVKLDEDDAEEDSLNTHPDCKKRKASILSKFEKEGKKSSGGIDNSAFNKINNLADFEIIEQYIEDERYVKAMFNALYLLNKYPENKYLHSVVDKNLMLLYYFTKGHKQTRILSFPHLSFNENYNRYLSFLQKLTLSEINKFKTNYHQMYLTKFGKDENTDFYDTFEKIQAKRDFKEKQAIAADFNKRYLKTMSNRILQKDLDMNNPKSK